jgi:transcriptional regulator with XRE-family HTH domain
VPASILPPELVVSRRLFGARLRQLREDAKLSQEALAEAAGLDRKTVSRLEGGVHSTLLDHVFTLAAALGTPPAALFTWAAGPGNP